MNNAEFAKRFKAAAWGDNPPPRWAQALNVVGEAGEFAEAYRRFTGHARRVSLRHEVEDELADVVIAAYVFADGMFDLDLAIAEKRDVIMSRGFKEEGKTAS